MRRRIRLEDLFYENYDPEVLSPLNIELVKEDRKLRKTKYYHFKKIYMFS